MLDRFSQLLKFPPRHREPSGAPQQLPWPGRLWFALASSIVVVWHWPHAIEPLRFLVDSSEYLNWPKKIYQDGVLVLGARPFGYPLILDVLGSGAVLVHVQTWLSVLAWGFLGWTLWGSLGALLFLVVAYCPAIRLWNSAIMSESISFSVMLLGMAVALRLTRSWSWAGFAVWSVLTILFASLRDSNLVLLSMFPLPFLRCGARRMAAVAAVLALVLSAGAIDAERNDRWKVGYLTAFQLRIWPYAEARAHFAELGMPVSGPQDDKAAFVEWLEERGRGEYLPWVLGQSRSYARPPAYFFRGGGNFGAPDTDLSSYLEQRYFKRMRIAIPSGSVTTVANWLFRHSAPPLWLAACFLIMPLFDLLVRRRIGPESLWATSLVVAAWVGAFAAYHASGSDMPRHILGASLLYRLAAVFALSALWSIARTTFFPASTGAAEAGVAVSPAVGRVGFVRGA